MRFLTAVILASAALSASAQLYRWTDERGRTHFTDTPPPAAAKNVQKREPPPPPAAAAEPYALQQARQNSPVTLYSQPGCDPCHEARELLNARGIPFKEVSVTTPAQFEELTKAAGSNAVPALIVGSAKQQGFEQGAYERMLDAAGYPKIGVLPSRHQQEPRLTAKPAAPSKAAPPLGPYAPRRGPASAASPE